MKNVILENCVFANGGDAAIGLSIVKALRIVFGEKLQVTIVDKHADYIKRYYPEQTFVLSLSDHYRRSPLIRLIKFLCMQKHKTIASNFINFCSINNKIYLNSISALFRRLLVTSDFLGVLNAYRKADLIVSTGGTYLVEHYKLLWRIAELEKSLHFRAPYILFTQSMGPFKDCYNRQKLSQIFRHCELIFLRDEKSKEHVKELGEDLITKVRLSSDIAFLFAERLSELPATSFVPNQVSKVCISVREWRYFDNVDPKKGMEAYKRAVCELVSDLVRNQNSEVTFLSTCQGIEEYWTDDSAVAEEIYDALDCDVRKNVSVDRNFHSPEELVEMLGCFDMTISTRMHMAILSLCAGTPVLPIAYEFKTEELFDRLGMKGWVCRIEDLETTDLVQLQRAFVRDVVKITKISHAAVLREYRCCLDEIALLKSSIALVEDDA